MKIPTYIYRRYILFQLPSLSLVALLSYAVHVYLNLPLRIVLLIIVLWVVKDIIMFPFVWKSYSSSTKHHNSLIGKTGITLTVLDPKGSVRVNGEIWRANSSKKETIKKGDQIKVTAINGMELTVEPFYNNSGK